MPYIVDPRPLLSTRRGQKRLASFVLSFTLAGILGVAVSAGQAPTTTQAAEAKPVTVTVTVDGETRKLISTNRTVGDMLAEHKIELKKLDRCSCPLKTTLKEDMEITITRIRAELVTERTPLAFPTKETYTSGLPVGKRVVKQIGANGARVKVFRDVYKDDKRVSHVKHKETVVKPRQQVVAIGTRGMTLASRGYFSGRRIVEMHATGYGPGAADNGRWANRTASGLRPGFGVVAVDPRFIPLGTRLYIEGYGYAVAGDTGGAIKGNRIDLGYDSYSEAKNVGRKKVRVLILN